MSRLGVRYKIAYNKIQEKTKLIPFSTCNTINNTAPANYIFIYIGNLRLFLKVMFGYTTKIMPPKILNPHTVHLR